MTGLPIPNAFLALGEEMHAFGRELFPICRSITGDGVRETLARIKARVGGLEMRSFRSGENVYDWTIPLEWRIRDAHIIGPDGKAIIRFADNNLHVVGYSEPVDAELELDELQAHLYSLPDQPDAIPYVTSYYKQRWGFCLADQQRKQLAPGRYRVRIDSELFSGQLDYGEASIPGASDQEILISTYVCHPSMANNELSGPLVSTWLYNWLRQKPRRYSYRFVFIPETIGAIAYISRNLAAMKENIVAGFVLTCIGDDRCYSYLASRSENTLADRAARHVLSHIDPRYKAYPFLDRGSDERQYCAPGVDLPVASIMRSKYGTYPEYHTSLDDFALVTPSGLAGGLHALVRTVEAIESNWTWRVTTLGEPQLGRRSLYPTLSIRDSATDLRGMMNFLAYADGTRDLISIADKIGEPIWELAPIAAILESHDLIRRVEAAK
jgi:aminopeptidase-like protein